MIQHIFQCPSCNRVDETKSEVREEKLPPHKLSMPATRMRAA